MRRVGRVPAVIWPSMVWLAVAAAAAATPLGPWVWATVAWPVLHAGYRMSWRWSARLAAVSAIAAAGLWVGRAAPLIVVETALASAALPAALALATAAAQRRVLSWDQQQRAAREAIRTFEQQARSGQQDHAVLEATIEQLAGLYELTKRLLSTLDRTEAVRYLADALAHGFPQAAYRLCFVRSGERVELERVVRLGAEGPRADVPGGGDRWLLARLARRPAIWSARPMVGVASDREIEVPDELRTATAFPLVMDGVLQGFLVAVGLGDDEIERCGIVVSQFALALRRIRLYERVQELAIHDGLTGVFVRRHLIHRLHEEVARAARHDRPVAFLMVDLDHFKRINDTYGHLVGDTVLRELAALLRTQVREVDLLGRYGGEEFAVVLPDTGRPEARAVAERVRQVVLGTAFQAYDERLALTVSIGVAAFPQDAADAAELVERADAAMYAAKLAGRDRVEVVTPETPLAKG